MLKEQVEKTFLLTVETENAEYETDIFAKDLDEDYNNIQLELRCEALTIKDENSFVIIPKNKIDSVLVIEK